MIRRTRGSSPNSPNQQPSPLPPTSPPSKPNRGDTRKSCPPGFKLVNGRCEFVYDKKKLKKKK